MFIIFLYYKWKVTLCLKKMRNFAWAPNNAWKTKLVDSDNMDPYGLNAFHRAISKVFLGSNYYPIKLLELTLETMAFFTYVVHNSNYFGLFFCHSIAFMQMLVTCGLTLVMVLCFFASWSLQCKIKT
jgi:hypothetical protein